MDLKQIETEIDEYLVMSHSKYPEVAKSYLMEGFNLGVEYASKLSTNKQMVGAEPPQIKCKCGGNLKSAVMCDSCYESTFGDGT